MPVSDNVADELAAGGTARRVAERMGIGLCTLQRRRQGVTAAAGRGLEGNGREDGTHRNGSERKEILPAHNKPPR